MSKFWVCGGEWVDTSFTHLIPDSKIELYGPFETEKDAHDEWRLKTWMNVDNCHHRLKITQQPFDILNLLPEVESEDERQKALRELVEEAQALGFYG